MSTTNFGTQVRIELIKRNMTPADLAEQMRVSANYVRKIINGKRKAAERRQEIKEILNLEVSNEEQANSVNPSAPEGRSHDLGGSHLGSGTATAAA